MNDYESKIENELIMANGLLEAIENILDGEEVSEFTLSFPIVRRVDDLLRAVNIEAVSKPYKTMADAMGSATPGDIILEVRDITQV